MATALDTYAPYDSGPGANVTEDGWRLFSKHWRGDGVIRSGSSGTSNSNFAVFGDSTGMQVKVPTGECWIQGNWGRTIATKIMPVAAAHATLGRRDLVVLRDDFVNNRIEVDVKTGTPNATPAYPSLTQNSSMWEIQLGKIVVGAAVVTITAGNVTALQTFTDGAASYTVDSGLQAVPTNTITGVDWDLPQFDSSAVDRNGLRKFILQRAGQWAFFVNLNWSINATGTRFVWLGRTADTGFVNRLGINSVAPAPSPWQTVQTTVAMERFSLGEEVGVFCYQDSGISLNLENQWAGTRVSMYWLGP